LPIRGSRTVHGSWNGWRHDGRAGTILKNKKAGALEKPEPPLAIDVRSKFEGKAADKLDVILLAACGRVVVEIILQEGFEAGSF
jgi:hypothetical protein